MKYSNCYSWGIFLFQNQSQLLFENVKKMVCYRCDRPGHFARECPNSGDEGQFYPLARGGGGAGGDVGVGYGYGYSVDRTGFGFIGVFGEEEKKRSFSRCKQDDIERILNFWPFFPQISKCFLYPISYNLILNNYLFSFDIYVMLPYHVK